MTVYESSVNQQFVPSFCLSNTPLYLYVAFCLPVHIFIDT